MDEEEIKEIIRSKKTNALLPASYEFRFADGTGVVHWASSFGNTDLIRLLIREKVNLDTPGGKHLSTPLFFALHNKKYHTALLLFKNNADINYMNTLHYTPLHICALNDDILGFILLASSGANLNLTDRREMTPINLAYTMKRRRVARLGKSLGLLPQRRFSEKAKKGVIFVSTLLLYFACLCSCDSFAILVYLMILWKVLVRTKMIILLNNIFYIATITLSLRSDPELGYTIFRYLILYRCISKNRPRSVPRNHLGDVKTLVESLVHEDRYNEKTFCYTCMVKKEGLIKHCSICDACMNIEVYHCPILGRCITRVDQAEVTLFAFLTFYLLLLLVKVEVFSCFHVGMKMMMAGSVISILRCSIQNKSTKIDNGNRAGGGNSTLIE